MAYTKKYYEMMGRKYVAMLKKAKYKRRLAIARRKRYLAQKEKERREMIRKKVIAMQTAPATIQYRKKLKMLRNKDFVNFIIQKNPYWDIHSLRYGMEYDELLKWHKDYLKYKRKQIKKKLSKVM